MLSHVLTTDLTNLCQIYTHYRNRARADQWTGSAQQDRELAFYAKDAAKEYHDAIRRQKRAHWKEFLEEDTNISQ